MTELPARQIRSFVRRAGRFSDKQRQALTNLSEKYQLNSDAGEVDFAAIFGRTAPTILEVGFGMGHSLLAMAQQNPAYNYLGVEVHLPGIGTLLANLAKHQISNVRIFAQDAVVVMRQAIPNDSLSAIQIYFPDPWPKTRHHKRRLIQDEFVKLAIAKLKTGGIIHCATDWQNYAEHMLQVLSQQADLINQAGNAQFISTPQRPETKFESRGKRLGHQIWDLIFVKG